MEYVKILSLLPGHVQVIDVVPSNRGTVWLYHQFGTQSVASNISPRCHHTKTKPGIFVAMICRLYVILYFELCKLCFQLSLTEKKNVLFAKKDITTDCKKYFLVLAVNLSFDSIV